MARMGFKGLEWACLVALLGAGCANLPAVGGGANATYVAGLVAAAALEGRAFAPSGVLSNGGAAAIQSGGGVLSNGGAAVLSNGGANLVPQMAGAWQALGFRLLQAQGEVALANALTYLTTPDEQFYKMNGKAVVATTDAAGRFRFTAGVPKRAPVVVSVILPGNRRVVGFTVPDGAVTRLDVSMATTYVTEFLRAQAQRDGVTMAKFGLEALQDLAQRTATAITNGRLPVPSLQVGDIQAMNQRYAVAVGTNVEGLGEAWAQLLGRRIIASTVVAGSGTTDDGGDGGPATKADFYRLKGVVLLPGGDVVVADEGNHRVRRIAKATGVVTTIAGTGQRGFEGDGGSATKAQLCFPRSLALSPDASKLYIFDSQNVRVRQLDFATGLLSTVAGNPEARGAGMWENGHGGDGGPAVKAKLFSPRGGAVDADGTVYVVDGLKGTKFHTLRAIDPNGTIRTVAGIPERDGGWEGDGGLAKEALLNYTNQVWLTPDRQLYLAESNAHCIRKIDLSTGVITTVVGVGGQKAETPEPDGKAALNTKLNQPFGVAVDRRGRIFISERGFHRVLVVDVDGKVKTLVGGGTDTGEGEGRKLTLNEPHDLAFDANGNLLVADSRAARLRLIHIRDGI